MLVPDGYNNARELDEEVFKSLGAKLDLDTHTGLLQLTMRNDKIMMSGELAKVVGFNWWISFAPEFQCYYFSESSCLFYLN